jgi:hypothetical protein
MNNLAKVGRKVLNVNLCIHRYSSTALSKFRTHLNAEIDSIKSAGTFKTERVIVTKQGAHIKVAGRNETILNFCANNYLGLSVYKSSKKNQICFFLILFTFLSKLKESPRSD